MTAKTKKKMPGWSPQRRAKMAAYYASPRFKAKTKKAEQREFASGTFPIIHDDRPKRVYKPRTVVAGRDPTVEVKVGSEIVFHVGGVRLIVKAVS